MIHSVDAVFEEGRFRLLGPKTLDLKEGQHVRLTVEVEDAAEDALSLAEAVYAGLEDEEITEIERIALDQQPFFGPRDP
jgi:predicted DNA-binding antitoxin AbrB/MazE fold protein